jgi:(2Fe-2S) ferredoxin
MSDLQIDNEGTLPGTVKFYEQHLIVCSGHTDWPAKVEESGGFITALHKAIQQDNTGRSTRLTACNAPALHGGIDLLLYPQAVRLVGLGESDIPALLHLLDGGPAHSLTTVVLEKPLFLACGHTNRDPRCGACGPAVQAGLIAHLTDRGLDTAADVWFSSHLGGHRFAGVVVCYPSGNWYGRVTADDVAELVQAELYGGKPLSRLWRGRMGLTMEEQLAGALRRK